MNLWFELCPMGSDGNASLFVLMYVCEQWYDSMAILAIGAIHAIHALPATLNMLICCWLDVIIGSLDH